MKQIKILLSCIRLIQNMKHDITTNCGKFLERWKFLKRCLQRNLYPDQDAIVRTRHGTTDWFQIGKRVHQSCILSPCLFNFYAEYIMGNARQDESQAGIKIAGRKIDNLRYAADTILMAEIVEEFKEPFDEGKKESGKVGLKLNSQKTKTMASGPITSWQIDGETMKTVTDYFLGLQNHCRW